MPNKPSAPLLDRSVSPIVSVSVIVGIIALLSLGGYLLIQKPAFLTLSPKTATPTPIQLRPDDGVKGTYAVSQGKHDGPTVSQIVFDPLDVQKGQRLTVSVKITNTTAVQKVTGLLETDNGTQEAVFTKNSGTDLKGEWQTTLTLEDSVLYTYILRVTATAANGTGTAGAAPRSQ